mmetsp:Transcript_42916/g.80062  ORF Transcript_42916/g.80062 Transcript_42916/m.80062 type:complete len:212 (-) Transcript_42916:42-677(-)
MTNSQKKFVGGSGQPTFHLVWCFERCFKASQYHRLKRLTEMAGVMGCHLVCQRKAKGTLAWLEASMPSVPVVVMADWREVKPLVEGIQTMEKECPGSGKKIRLGVLAASAKIYRRSRDWAASQDGLKAKVAADFSEGVDLEGFIRECVDDPLFESSASDPCNASDLCSADVSPFVAQPVLERLVWALKDPNKALQIQRMLEESMQHQVYED